MSEANFSNRWREGAEQILSEKKAKSSPPTLVSKRAKNNPTKEEYQKRAIDAGKFIAEMTPIIGDAIAVKEVYDEITKPNPNWFLVGALGTAAVIGLIPGLGDAAAKLIKKGAERALDVSSRIEINLNTLGSTGGNIKIKPKDLADVQAKKIQKILKKEKNVNDNFYMLHGGTDFDKMDLKAAGSGEPGSLRPLGRGIYGSRIVDPKNIETIKNAYLQASGFAGHFGTSATRNYAGFSHPLYKQAFKDASIPIETTESLLKELQKKVPIEVTTEQVGKIHLFKVPRTKELKVYDFRNRKGIAQNTENVKKTYPREFSSRFTIASPKFGDSQVVLQPLGEVEEMAIHDTNIVERIAKLDLPEEFFENINKRKLRTNELDPNYPYDYIVDKKLNNLKKEAQNITDRENLDPKTMEINLLKAAQNKGYLDESVNIEDLPKVNYPETIEPYHEDFLKEMQEDLEVSRRNVFVPEDRLELGEDSTQSLGLDSGKRIPKKTVEYNKGGFNQSKNSMFKKGGMTMATEDQQMQMLLQGGGMKDDGLSRDPVSGNEIPPGSMANEVRDDVAAQLSEGEYVVPADAVQYHGLRFYEATVQDAKKGLAAMQANGRIGGTPAPDTANRDVPPQGMPTEFNIEDLMASMPQQQQQVPMGADKGGLVPGFQNSSVVTGKTSTNPNIATTYTSPLDFSNVRQAFDKGVGGSGSGSGSGAGPGQMYHTRRYINDSCEIKLVNTNEVGNPLGSVQEGFKKVVSTQGLQWMKTCSVDDPELGLTDEEKNILGPDKVKEYEDGTLPDPTSTDTPTEVTPETKKDDDKKEKEYDTHDFHSTWDVGDFEKYIDDIAKLKTDERTALDRGLDKMFTWTKKLNQPYIFERAITLLNDTENPLTDEEKNIVSKVFTIRVGSKPKENINLPGDKGTLTWNPEIGMYENSEILDLDIVMPEGFRENRKQIEKDANEIRNNAKSLELTSLEEDRDHPGLRNMDFAGLNNAQVENMIKKQKAKDIEDEMQQLKISQSMSGGDPTNLASGKFDNQLLDKKWGASNTTFSGVDAGEIGSDKPPSWYKPKDQDKPKDNRDEFKKNQDEDDWGAKPHVADSYAKSLMNEKDDGASLQVEYDQYNKDEAALSDAYSGGDPTNLASGKFKTWNKGGIVQRKKRTTKKKK